MPAGRTVAAWRMALPCLVLTALGGCGDEPQAVPDAVYRQATSEFESDRARYASEVSACAAGRGVDAVPTWDHGFRLPEGLDAQEAATFWAVVEECAEAIYPPPRELADGEVEEQYRLLLAARRCLEDAGFAPREPSGFAAFLEAYRSDDRVPWSPYEPFTSDVATFRAAVEACPQPGRY